VWNDGLSVCLSDSLSVCVCLCVCLSVSLCLSDSLSVCVLVLLSICLSVCLSVCVCVCLSIFQSISLSVSLSVCVIRLSICLSVVPIGRPGKPTASHIEARSVIITWTEVDCLRRNGNITKYLVDYGVGNVRDIELESKSTSLTVTNLSPFTKYTFTVKGINRAGEGPPSEASEEIQSAEDSELYLHLPN